MPHWARKKDENHDDVVDMLLRTGWSVLETYRAPKCVDLVIAKAGRTLIAEVKALGEPLTKDQAELFASWQGEKVILRTIDDVLAI